MGSETLAPVRATPDALAALVGRCKALLAHIQDKVVRHEYEVFLKRRVAEQRQPGSKPVMECLRPSTKDEKFWAEINTAPHSRMAGYCTLDIEGETFLVLPMRYTALALLDAQDHDRKASG